jgi:serine-type D-Ala-D-Ala carboxypeptidase/endopeptidase (penicillin-binding protein 4)
MKKSVYGLGFSVVGYKSFTFFVLLIALTSCSVTKQISKQANSTLLKDSAVNTGHIGISIYEPATQKYWYNHNATQYFIPASNTKLFTLYAGMKYLGDSLVGLRYNEIKFHDDEDTNKIYNQLNIDPTGDPTFLHPSFRNQKVYNFLKKFQGGIVLRSEIEIDKLYGKGWSWDDYNEEYMPTKSAFPIYANTIHFNINHSVCRIEPPILKNSKFVSIYNNLDTLLFFRKRDANEFSVAFKSLINYSKKIPFIPNNSFVQYLLEDTLKNDISIPRWANQKFLRKTLGFDNAKIIYSQPSDSLFKPMMHQSDNFFAEQTLIMASNEFLGFMSDEKMIDTVLKSSLKNITQRPKWVDGSGLSRYNLFTPQSFVQILNQLKLEFELERLKVILPTGGTGTLSSYYKNYSGKIFAKTGTLSNNCALSGYLITNKGKLLIFSVLNNNYITGATPIRKAVERFLGEIIEKY